MTKRQPYLDELRRVIAPRQDEDIVSLGWIDSIDHDGDELVVRLAETCAEHPQIAQVAEEVREILQGINGHSTVRVTQSWDAKAEPDDDTSHPHSPLQAELIAEGRLPEPDPIGMAMSRPDIARETGYQEEGPTGLDGPGGTTGEDAADPTYRGDIPVFQWDIDPEDDERPSGEAIVEDDQWEYRLWWQVHPEEIVYASIQALGNDQVDHEGRARPHAVGRAVVVNLAYDLRRQGVVAVYGTVRDFRPFIHAFHEGFDGLSAVGDEPSQQNDEE